MLFSSTFVGATITGKPDSKAFVMETKEGRLPTVFVIPLMQFIAGVFLFIALLYKQRDLVMLALLVLGFMGMSKVWSMMSLSRIKCCASVDKERLFPGDILNLQVDVQNAKFLPVWLRVTTSVKGSLSLYSGEGTFTGESGLLWYQKVTFYCALIARKRGIHRVGPPHVTVSDLFGFFPREKERMEDLDVIVYPQLYPLRSVELPRLDFFGIPGARNPVEDPVYILGVRDYQNWRPARYIHWKASARHHHLQEKAFESSEQAKVLLVLDVSRFVKKEAREDFEKIIELVASLAVQFDQLGYAVGFATNGAVEGGTSVLATGRNRKKMSSILETLARLQMDVKEDLLYTLRHRIKPLWGMSCLHFSCEEDMSLIAAEEYYSHMKIPVSYCVCHPESQGQGDGRKVRGKVLSVDEIRFKEKDKE
ncbi:MAG: DUF58 domain-containing protein [Deltaproteobacteria bacterium]|nr:DUF58 domain-containing protein [Deltaproteobacteria bacterium]